MTPWSTLVRTATATMISDRPDVSADFVRDLEEIADALDFRLRLELAPEHYAMVRDLRLATRVLTITRETVEEQVSAA